MKRLLTLAFCLVALAGCDFHAYEECHSHDGSHHCHNYVPDPHPTNTVVYTSANNGGGSNNIIIVEEQESYCMWDSPYYHDPEYCTFDGLTCCTWLNIGEEEEWCYTDYCGWELYSVYTYYQKEYPYEEDKANRVCSLLPAFPQRELIQAEKP